ncbi:PAX3- and PAX7-binding protein 1 [Manis javanica]|nr:PAX3- and PAX7-binding protein 1 [Manis javanica]
MLPLLNQKPVRTSQRRYHRVGPARKLQLPAGPAQAAHPRPARPGPPPPGLRTGPGGGREGGRGASGGRDPAKCVKPRWRCVLDSDAGWRGLSHDQRTSPLPTVLQKTSTFLSGLVYQMKYACTILKSLVLHHGKIYSPSK